MYGLNNLKRNNIMDFRTELAKWGYNKGNSIDVDILVNEILPSLFSQQEKICDSEVIQRIRASKSDAEARRIIRTI
jgi:hypothetical protein